MNEKINLNGFKKIKLFLKIAVILFFCCVFTIEIILQLYFYYYKVRYVDEIVIKNKIFLNQLKKEHQLIPESIKHIFYTVQKNSNDEFKKTGIKIVDLYLIFSNKKGSNYKCSVISKQTKRKQVKHIVWSIQNLMFSYYCYDYFNNKEIELMYFNKMPFSNERNKK